MTAMPKPREVHSKCYMLSPSIVFNLVRVNILPSPMALHHMHAWYPRHKKARTSNSLQLEFQMVVSHLVGAGNQVQVHCSLLISHLSSPFKNKQEMGLLHVQGWPGVGRHLPVVSQCCTDGHVPVSLGFLFLFINHELMENVSHCFLYISGYPDVFFY